MSIQIPIFSILLISTIFDINNAFYLSLHRSRWLNGSNYCRSYCNSHLASVHSQNDHLKTLDLITRNQYVYGRVWLGLNDIQTADIFQWSDGSHFNFGNITNTTSGKIIKGTYPWRADEPDIGDTYQGVAVENDQWIDKRIVSYGHYMCNDCSSKINKYAAVTGVLNYTEAETFCKDTFKTSLASIHNNDDMIEAVTACRGVTRASGCWIGLNDAGVTDLRGQYKWTDGTTTDYGTKFYEHPWYASEPTLDLSKENYCVFMDPEDGNDEGEYLWDDAWCGHKIKAVCNAPSEICNSNEWVTIKGDTNNWKWNTKPCQMVKTVMEADSVAVLANKQYVNSAGVLKIDMMYSITSSATNGNAGVVLYLSKANNANCNNYYYIGVAAQQSIIFIGKYIDNVFNLIAYKGLDSAYNLGTDYTLSIELTSGTEWNILFNKQSMIRVNDNQFNNELILLSGYIGIRNVQVEMNVRSLFISGEIQYEDNNVWYNQCANTATVTSNNPIFTSQPTKYPTVSPSDKPTIAPSDNPSTTPTQYPSLNPSKYPTQNPTHKPTNYPSDAPSKRPTGIPTESPTKIPTDILDMIEREYDVMQTKEKKMDKTITTVIIVVVIVSVIGLVMCTGFVFWKKKGKFFKKKTMDTLPQVETYNED